MKIIETGQFFCAGNKQQPAAPAELEAEIKRVCWYVHNKCHAELKWHSVTSLLDSENTVPLWHQVGFVFRFGLGRFFPFSRNNKFWLISLKLLRINSYDLLQYLKIGKPFLFPPTFFFIPGCSSFPCCVITSWCFTSQTTWANQRCPIVNTKWSKTLFHSRNLVDDAACRRLFLPATHESHFWWLLLLS